MLGQKADGKSWSVGTKTKRAFVVDKKSQSVKFVRSLGSGLEKVVRDSGRIGWIDGGSLFDLFALLLDRSICQKVGTENCWYGGSISLVGRKIV